MSEIQDQLGDEELAVLVQNGDKEKFGFIMERYEKKLFRYGRKFLSNPDNIEDMVQDVFVKTYQSIRSFDVTQKFSPWIYRIAHNTFVNALKKQSKSPLYLFDFDTLISHPIYEDPKKIDQEQKEIKGMLDKGLSELSPPQREILVLYFLEEMSYKEIGDILHIPMGTVGVRLRRAKQALKKACEKLGIHYNE